MTKILKSTGNRMLLRDFGTCLNFNGINAYALLGPSSNLNVFAGSPGNVFSIVFRIKFDPNVNAGKRIFSEANNATGASEYNLLSSDNGNPRNLRMWVRNDANTQQILQDTTNEVFKPNIWQTIGIVDNNGVVSVFVGGDIQEKAQGSLNYTRSGVYTNTRTSIGARVSTSPASFLKGLMDDVIIFKGLAITQAQLDTIHYMSQNPSTPTAWYKMDEGSGTTLNDASGNGNTGAITNATYSSDVVMKPRVAKSGRVAVSGRVTA